MSYYSGTNLYFHPDPHSRTAMPHSIGTNLYFQPDSHSNIHNQRQQNMLDGKITCRYDDHCVDDELRKIKEPPAIDSVKSSLSDNKPSQTTTPKTSTQPAVISATTTAMQFPLAASTPEQSTSSTPVASAIPKPSSTLSAADLQQQQKDSLSTQSADHFQSNSRAPSSLSNPAKKLLKRSLPSGTESNFEVTSSPAPLRRYIGH